MPNRSSLVDLKLDINTQNNIGQNIFYAAASMGYTGLISFLAEKGATLDKWYQKDKNGYDPLMIARGETAIRNRNGRCLRETNTQGWIEDF